MTDSRLRELARHGARHFHCRWKEGTKQFVESGHVGMFFTCPHPDCVLVREPAVRAASLPVGEPKPAVSQRDLSVGGDHGVGTNDRSAATSGAETSADDLQLHLRAGDSRECLSSARAEVQGAARDARDTAVTPAVGEGERTRLLLRSFVVATAFMVENDGHCRYCGSPQAPGVPVHKPGCLLLVAQTLIAAEGRLS